MPRPIDPALKRYIAEDTIIKLCKALSTIEKPAIPNTRCFRIQRMAFKSARFKCDPFGKQIMLCMFGAYYLVHAGVDFKQFMQTIPDSTASLQLIDLGLFFLSRVCRIPQCASPVIGETR